MITGIRNGAAFILCDKAEALYLAWLELCQAAPKATRKATAARRKYFEHRAACTDCTPLEGNEKHGDHHVTIDEQIAIERAEKAEAKADRYEEALQQIDNWAKAYPVDVFPEPDLKRVREVLEAAGITIDQVSASNMRHVITGVARIVENALKGGEE